MVIIEVVSFLETVISLRAKLISSKSLFGGEHFKLNKVLSDILKSLENNFGKKFSIFSSWTVAKNPNLPAFTPIIGIFLSLTNVAALKIVPSPPMLIKKSKFASKSVWFSKVFKFFLKAEFSFNVFKYKLTKG